MHAAHAGYCNGPRACLPAFSQEQLWPRARPLRCSPCGTLSPGLLFAKSTESHMCYSTATVMSFTLLSWAQLGYSFVLLRQNTQESHTQSQTTLRLSREGCVGQIAKIAALVGSLRQWHEHCRAGFLQVPKPVVGCIFSSRILCFRALHRAPLRGLH